MLRMILQEARKKNRFIIFKFSSFLPLLAHRLTRKTEHKKILSRLHWILIFNHQEVVAWGGTGATLKTSQVLRGLKNINSMFIFYQPLSHHCTSSTATFLPCEKCHELEICTQKIYNEFEQFSDTQMNSVDCSRAQYRDRKSAECNTKTLKKSDLF